MKLSLPNPLDVFRRRDSATVPHGEVATPLDPLQMYQHIKEFPMATAAVAVAAIQTKKPSFLDHVGHVLRQILHIGQEAATIASPVITAFFPEIAPLFVSSIGLAYAAQATISGTTGSGEQKLAQALAGINPLIDKFVADNKLGDWETGNRAKFVSAIVDAINLIPAPKA